MKLFRPGRGTPRRLGLRLVSGASPATLRHTLDKASECKGKLEMSPDLGHGLT